ncbi:DUF969 domain-containing protein [Clostridium oceanicum]|uniref:DUF969 domain-containing protein n=1 Tax=Clostridium oceanicum TaxID=1543 RepID=A0ABP3UTW6_9CLOT
MIRLIGVLIIIVGFALGLDAIGIVMGAGLVTGLVGGMSINDILTTLGGTFVASRYIALFLITLPVIAVLERNGLKQSAANFIAKIKNATPGKVIISYGFVRIILAAFNVSVGGVAGFVRPIVYPMATGSIENEGHKLDEKDADEIKGLASSSENVTWFFGQVLFIAGAGILLVKSTLEPLGYSIDPLQAVKAEIPVAISALVLSSLYTYFKDRKMMKKYTKVSKK